MEFLPRRRTVQDPVRAAMQANRRALVGVAIFSAIIQGSDDAIVSKTLQGFIISWNRGAERIFGYTAEEAVGQHITLIIPEDRLSEEDHVLSSVRRGEKVAHFETIRQRKDGTLIDVSVTVSPIRDLNGKARRRSRETSARKRRASSC